MKFLFLIIIFSIYYLTQLEVVPQIVILNLLYGVLFVPLSNAVFALRTMYMSGEKKYKFFEYFHYANSINFINLFFPFRSGDALYFIGNPKKVISLRDNYIYLIRMKFLDVIILSLIITCLIFGDSIYVILFLGCIVGVALYQNARELLLSFIQVALIWVFVYANVSVINFTYLELASVCLNYVLPIFNFFVFSIGDILLSEVGLVSLSILVSLRFYVSVAVILTIIGSKIYGLKFS